jgi:AraC-like DNA-binding protein
MAEPLSSDQIFIRKLTEIVLTNLENEKFDVNELAKEAGISLYRLNGRLQSIRKKTSNQFIREIRLQKRDLAVLTIFISVFTSILVILPERS